MNYFELFDLIPAYFIDEQVLKKKFLQLSRQHHPDRFVLKSIPEQSGADDQSALNNQAFKTLSDPDRRLKYLLELKKAIHDEEVYALDQDFLMEMLDLNDLITEDAAAAASQLEQIEQYLSSEILPILKAYHHEDINEQNLIRLKDYHYKKRYILRIRENLNKFAAGKDQLELRD